MIVLLICLSKIDWVTYEYDPVSRAKFHASVERLLLADTSLSSDKLLKGCC
jgi:hypothetical protein